MPFNTSKEMQDEIGEMNKDDLTVVPSEPIKDEKEEEEKKDAKEEVREEEDDKEKDDKEHEEEEEKEEDVSKVIAKKEEEEEEEEKEEDDPYESIRKELEDVLAEKTIPKQEAEVKRQEAAPIEEIDFLQKFGIDEEAAIGPKELNQLLNAAYKEARSGSSKDQPDPKTIVAEQLAMIETNRRFYDKNKDLSKYRNFVSRVTSLMMAKLSEEDQKNLTDDEFMDRVADEARRRLKLKREEKKAEEKKNTPKFPKTKGQKKSKSTPKLSPLEEEMQAMTDATV